jgi:hypothetical protein
MGCTPPQAVTKYTVDADHGTRASGRGSGAVGQTQHRPAGPARDGGMRGHDMDGVTTADRNVINVRDAIVAPAGRVLISADYRSGCGCNVRKLGHVYAAPDAYQRLGYITVRQALNTKSC